jgi:hypothetical protein
MRRGAGRVSSPVIELGARVERAIAAVFLPAIISAILLFLLGTVLTGVPLIGALAGMGGFVLVAVHVGPLLIGAILGGLLA